MNVNLIVNEIYANTTNYERLKQNKTKKKTTTTEHTDIGHCQNRLPTLYNPL